MTVDKIKLIKLIKLLIVIAIASWIWYFFLYYKDLVFFNENNAFTWNVAEVFTGSEAIITWDIFTGNIETWVINAEKTYIEKFKDLIDTNDFITFNPPAQPISSNTTYQSRSSILNTYLKDNNFYFRTFWNISGGYLYIKLANAWSSDIFLYRHNSYWKCWNPISWKIIKAKSLLPSNQEFLFDLKEIPIVKFYDKSDCLFDWVPSINNNKINFIWWYYVWFDWNYIKEITIAREK